MFLFSLLLFWGIVAPPAIARLAKIITREKIGQPLRLWVERRFAGSWLDYLIHCPVCTSHWVAMPLTLTFGTICLVPFLVMFAPIYGNGVVLIALWAMGMLWAATTELAIVFWLGDRSS